MESKAAVLLVVIVDTPQLRWFVAGVERDGTLMPLLRSEEGDLAPYREGDADQQLGFLRHRLCGVVQRGCDRLWAQGKKAGQFVFWFDGRLPDPSGELTERVAEHFVQWMLNPPVIVFASEAGAMGKLTKLAGEMAPAQEAVMQTALPQLSVSRADLGAWELSRKKPTS